MKTFAKALSIFLVLAGLAVTRPLFASDTNAAAPAQLPIELQNLLKNADDFTLYSIDPTPDFEHKSANTFQNHAILGQLDVKSEATRAKLIAALNKGIAEQSGPPGTPAFFPDCFNPRHGIRAKKGDETVEFLICFECAQIQVSSNKGKSWLFMTSKTPAAVFNSVLKSAHVPLPTY